MLVSLILLIANPTAFDQKRVLVKGYVVLEFESQHMYLSEADAKHLITRNSVWLDVSEAVYAKRTEFNRRYVLVEGTFNARRRGHLGLSSGEIGNIGRFELGGSSGWIDRWYRESNSRDFVPTHESLRRSAHARAVDESDSLRVARGVGCAGTPVSRWQQLAPLLAPRGVTAPSGQVLRLNGQPLANVTLSVGGVETRSDGRRLKGKR